MDADEVARLAHGTAVQVIGSFTTQVSTKNGSILTIQAGMCGKIDRMRRFDQPINRSREVVVRFSPKIGEWYLVAVPCVNLVLPERRGG